MYPIVLDIATAPLPDAASYLDTPRAPRNYKDPAKIDLYIQEKMVEDLADAALDLDLARITAIGLYDTQHGDIDQSDFQTLNILCLRTERDEREALKDIGHLLQPDSLTLIRPIVTFNGFEFDLPILMRRAMYLGVPFPKLNIKYQSPHIDLAAELADHNPKRRRRSLSFYVRRLGWSDLIKPLDGAEEARVFETGDWDKLMGAVAHDLRATARLAKWKGLLTVPTAGHP